VDTNIVISLEGMNAIYDKMKGPKLMARKHGIDHDITDSDMDGYVMAWFMWQLKGDERASEAFRGDDAEILNNPLYIDQKADLGL